MGLSVSKDGQIKDDWYLETFRMPSSSEQVGQELIAPVFKCLGSMQEYRWGGRGIKLNGLCDYLLENARLFMRLMEGCVKNCI